MSVYSLPCRELASSLGLWIRVPDWDMFEESGKLASICLETGTSLKDLQRWTLIRKDLLESFLGQNSATVIWLISGERQAWFNGTPPNPESLGFIPYRTFTEVFKWKDGRLIQAVERNER